MNLRKFGWTSRVSEAETAQTDRALAAGHGRRSACCCQEPAAHDSGPAGSPWTACRTLANIDLGCDGGLAGLLQHLRLPESGSPCRGRADAKVATGDFHDANDI